ncbi:MAG: 4-hydroxy-tetrahydrodipicolinate reductase [candidate division WOR-3 bacterium]
MIKVILIGACGKMASAVASIINQEKDIEIVGGIESVGHPLIGQPFGKGFIQSDLSKIINNCDVVVEFAIPEITLPNVKIAAKSKKPYIVGTTGIKDINDIKKYSKKIPILISPNFSVGVNALFNLTQNAIRLLSDFDIEIIETHHKMKRDAPSGTAKKLAEIINKEREQAVKIDSIRIGDIIGEHTVMFVGNGERLELTHRAFSRNAFAVGVIKAIRFIINQRPGFYSMNDVIGYKPN